MKEFQVRLVTIGEYVAEIVVNADTEDEAVQKAMKADDLDFTAGEVFADEVELDRVVEVGTR